MAFDPASADYQTLLNNITIVLNPVVRNETIQTTNFLAVSNTLYLVSSIITVTLPLTPAVNDIVQIIPLNGISGITIDANGGIVMDDSSLVLDISNRAANLIYVDSTNGWRLF